MHLADAFIQSDLHCIQVSFYILSALAFPGNRTYDLGVASAMLYQLSYRKAQTQFNWTTRTHCTNTTYLLSLDTIQCTSTTRHMNICCTFAHLPAAQPMLLIYNLLHLTLLLCIDYTLCIDTVHNVDVPIRCNVPLIIECVFIVHCVLSICMCILHIVFCTVCKYVLSICKLLLLFFALSGAL